MKPLPLAPEHRCRAKIRRGCMDAAAVHSLRLESNRFASCLFTLYCAIERAMQAGERSIDDLFGGLGREKMTKALSDAIVRKLREDGFTVGASAARKSLGRLRISWT